MWIKFTTKDIIILGRLEAFRIIAKMFQNQLDAMSKTHVDNYELLLHICVEIF